MFMDTGSVPFNTISLSDEIPFFIFCRFSVYVYKNTMYFEKHIQYVSGISTFVAVNGYTL